MILKAKILVNSSVYRSRNKRNGRHQTLHEKTQVVCTVSIKPAGLVSFGCDNPVVNLI